MLCKLSLYIHRCGQCLHRVMMPVGYVIYMARSYSSYINAGDEQLSCGNEPALPCFLGSAPRPSRGGLNSSLTSPGPSDAITSLKLLTPSSLAACMCVHVNGLRAVKELHFTCDRGSARVMHQAQRLSGRHDVHIFLLLHSARSALYTAYSTRSEKPSDYITSCCINAR